MHGLYGLNKGFLILYSMYFYILGIKLSLCLFKKKRSIVLISLSLLKKRILVWVLTLITWFLHMYNERTLSLYYGQFFMCIGCTCMPWQLNLYILPHLTTRVQIWLSQFSSTSCLFHASPQIQTFKSKISPCNK